MATAHIGIGRLASLVLAFILLCLLSTPAQAQAQPADSSLDDLFAALKAAPDADVARGIDQRIWSAWTHPPDPTLAARMAEVLQARQLYDLPRALDLLNSLVADYPDYAEGWNQRATVHFMVGDNESSLADIEKVLELEPRHFGALAGRVLIFLSQGKRGLALRDMQRALSVHPFLTERQLFPELQEMVRI